MREPPATGKRKCKLNSRIDPDLPNVYSIVDSSDFSRPPRIPLAARYPGQKTPSGICRSCAAVRALRTPTPRRHCLPGLRTTKDGRGMTTSVGFSALIYLLRK